MQLKEKVELNIGGNLYTMQKELDDFIKNTKNYSLSEESLFKKNLIGLLTEIGEFSNEHRGFKFWSNNQEPNVGEGELVNPLYEELIDILHFILSIGNSMNYGVFNIVIEPNRLGFEDLIIDWYQSIMMFNNDSSLDNYNRIFTFFGEVVHHLGLNETDIQKIYYAKYKKNIERQKTGY